MEATPAAVVFNSKTYHIKEQFARAEARLLKLAKGLNDQDPEAKVDAAVDIVNLITGIDKGDLNGLHLKPLMDLTASVTAQYRNAFMPAPSGDEGNDEAPAPVDTLAGA